MTLPRPAHQFPNEDARTQLVCALWGGFSVVDAAELPALRAAAVAAAESRFVDCAELLAGVATLPPSLADLADEALERLAPEVR